MKTLIKNILCLVFICGLSHFDGYSQTLKSAQQAYKDYIVKKSEMSTGRYDALMNAYNQYSVLANSINSKSPDYEACRKGLLQIFSELENSIYDFADQNNVTKTVEFAKAYVDLSLMYIVGKDNLMSREDYPKLTMYLANMLHNYNRYEEAIPYFQAYLTTEDQTYRKPALQNLAYCYYTTKNYTDAKNIVFKALESSPDDWQLLASAIELCGLTKDDKHMEIYLEKALTVKPDDPRLLLTQADMYSRMKNYGKASDVYAKLYTINPSNKVYNGLAFNNYNAGVVKFKASRKAINAADKAALEQTAKDYFNKALPYFDVLLENNPYEISVVKAKATCFSVLKNAEKLKETNQTLHAMNVQPVKMGAMPKLEKPQKPTETIKTQSIDVASNDYDITEEEEDSELSDVDVDIPLIPAKNVNTYAIVIGNEKYKYYSPVDYAHNDATSFKDYCHKLLGVPDKNIRLLKDASLGEMQQQMTYIQEKANMNPGKLNFLVYYAGHGIPNPKTGESYLLPADATGTDYEYCLSLEDVYKTLGTIDAKNVTVFLDACFSGGSRDGSMMAKERYVYTRPKEVNTNGKLIVFSATSGDQTAMPYDEKQHGFFTYYLLKNLKESKGSIDFENLAKNLKSNVDNQALDIKGKHQTPQIKAAPSLGESWKTKTLLDNE